MKVPLEVLEVAGAPLAVEVDSTLPHALLAVEVDGTLADLVLAVELDEALLDPLMTVVCLFPSGRTILITGALMSAKLDPSVEEFTCVVTVEEGLSDADGVEQRNEVCDSDFGKSLLFLHRQPQRRRVTVSLGALLLGLSFCTTCLPLKGKHNEIIN